MADTAVRVPVKSEVRETVPSVPDWWPFDPAWRRQFDRLLDQLPYPIWRPPALSLRDLDLVTRRDGWGSMPAVDIVEKDNVYEVSAELPGLTEKDIEVKYAGGRLTVKGEKEQAREEKKKDYHLTERKYGSFQRSFAMPEGVDVDKIAATFNNGVLTVSLPKTADAMKREKTIPIGKGK
jgi:HSP20 family protein